MLVRMFTRRVLRRVRSRRMRSAATMMGTKWRDKPTHVRPTFSWSLPVIAALVLVIVASAVHFVLFPLDAGATTTTTTQRFDRYTGSDPAQFFDIGGTSDVINIIRIRGENCLDAEDSTRLRLKRYVPSEALAVYRCVTP